MKQKDMFLESEGDAWHERNHAAVAEFDYGLDRAAVALRDIITSQFDPDTGSGAVRLLEVGCGEGRRLAWLKEQTGCHVSGIDPSPRAVAQARIHGVDAVIGTADRLPFDTGSIDILLFGFCLYVCDREDLFRIAQEADRVLKTNAWLVITDFFAPWPIRREYQHRRGMHVFKMDYRSLFSWYPDYVCYAHSVFHHGHGGFTDDPQEWAAVSVMRKLPAHV